MTERFAVVGAGQMGNGIAHVCATSGFAVTLIDVSAEALAKGKGTIEKNLERQVKKGALDAAALDTYEAILNRETLDLYNVITGKEPAPAELAGAVMDAIKAHVASSPLGRADPRKYEAMKKHFSN